MNKQHQANVGLSHVYDRAAVKRLRLRTAHCLPWIFCPILLLSWAACDASFNAPQAKDHEKDPARKELLLQATDQSAFADKRLEAIAALGKHPEPAVSVALARLLLPHEPFVVRSAVLEYLNEAPCEFECVAAVLYYFERIWRGDPNLEDGSSIPEVQRDIASRREHLMRGLEQLLKRERVECIRVLIRRYGLGSPIPSDFALYMTNQLGLTEACLRLELSSRSAMDKTTKARVDELMKNLSCKRQLPPVS